MPLSPPQMWLNRLLSNELGGLRYNKRQKGQQGTLETFQAQSSSEPMKRER